MHMDCEWREQRGPIVWSLTRKQDGGTAKLYEFFVYFASNHGNCKVSVSALPASRSGATARLKEKFARRKAAEGKLLSCRKRAMSQSPGTVSVSGDPLQ